MLKKIVSLLLIMLMSAPSMLLMSCSMGGTDESDTSDKNDSGESTDSEEASKKPEADTDADESEETTYAPAVVDKDNDYPVDSLKINGVPIEEYVISCNTSSGGVISHAAEELQEYIASTTGVRLTIATKPVKEGVKRISIDDTIISDPNDFMYYSDEDGIVLAGSAKRSALYAVYHFLENCLGWTFFTSDTEVCEEAEVIDLSGIDVTFEHAFDIRDIYWLGYFDEDISVKRYQNGEGKRRKMANDNFESDALGGSDSFHPYAAHSFSMLAEQDSSTQPCLNDENVYQTMLKNIIAWLSEDTDRKSIHVSQNDNNRYCTCDACSADIQKYGSPAGSIIKLVNRIDEDLKKNGFEDITIITFAYQYSFPCPVGIKCNEDIAIELCTIDYCYNHAFDDPICEKNKYCMDQIYAWTEICDQFYLWDYTINFKYYLSPFPNFDVLLDNIRIMSQIGAKGIIEQGNYQSLSGEFGELRCYLLAKALENPNMSDEEYYAHMDSFLEAYYGPGWEYIRKFIDFITELSNNKSSCFGIYSSPEEMFGDHAFADYNEQLIEWWDNAQLMAETELQLEHVKRSRLCCDYLRLGAIHTSRVEEGGDVQIAMREGDYVSFFQACKKLGIGRIAENYALPEYVDYSVNPRAWWSLHEYKD